MRFGILRAVVVLFAVTRAAGDIASTASARAETAAGGPSCAELSRRIARQDVLNRGFACGLAGQARLGAAKPGQRRAMLCDGAMQRTLAHRVARRAAELEACLMQRLETGDAPRPAVTQWSRNSATEPAATLRQDPADLRPADPRPTGDMEPVPLRDKAASPDDAAARAQSARRVRELLARSPTPNTAGLTRPTSVVREFRAGLAWSYAGSIDGMHCTKWEEPSDPHDWYDNYLCAARDLGFKWSYRGPIQGRGLKCIHVNEPSDPHYWHDNYFCWPRDLRVTFRFSAAGRLPGLDCLAIVEPSDPHTWRDNFLCYREARE